MLQVFLIQSHWVRVLHLLSQFLELGPCAINLSLSVGIFPYVIKLLKSHIEDYNHLLVGIWAKILAFDKTCQVTLVKDKALEHFIMHLRLGMATLLSSNKSLDNSTNNPKKYSVIP